MMYNNKLAVAIKTGGKVLREVGETVYIPFGSEYSFFVKNLNNVRADVKISIDGDEIADGDSFVVGPNQSVDIERFLRKNNLNEGNRFKFIERTAGIENHRGVGAEDGLIRVEFRFEKRQPKIEYNGPWATTCSPTDGGIWNDQYGHGNMQRKGGGTGNPRGANNMMRGGAVFSSSVVQDADFSAHTVSTANEAGITTEGSISDQQFRNVASFPLETETHVMVLKLLGETEDNRRVAVPVTTRMKPQCNKCGQVAPKFNTKFCGECGTSLQIV